MLDSKAISKAKTEGWMLKWIQYGVHDMLNSKDCQACFKIKNYCEVLKDCKPEEHSVEYADRSVHRAPVCQTSTQASRNHSQNMSPGSIHNTKPKSNTETVHS